MSERYHRYGRHMYRLGIAAARNNRLAEERFRTALRLWRSAGQYDPNASVGTFLFVIAVALLWARPKTIPGALTRHERHADNGLRYMIPCPAQRSRYGPDPCTTGIPRTVHGHAPPLLAAGPQPVTGSFAPDGSPSASTRA